MSIAEEQESRRRRRSEARRKYVAKQLYYILRKVEKYYFPQDQTDDFIAGFHYANDRFEELIKSYTDPDVEKNPQTGLWDDIVEYENPELIKEIYTQITS